jgi:DNA-binding NtrC family response regulator
MTSVLIVGTDTALIEGIAQTLTARNHELFFAGSLADALETVGDAKPLVVLVERSAIDEIRMTLRIPLASRGAFLVFHAEDGRPAPLPHRVQRATLAELELPLETQRLLALIRYVENRAHMLGADCLDDGAQIQAT